MPLYTRETLTSEKLPWVDIDDFEFFILGRNPGSMIHGAPPGPGEFVPYWGNYQEKPLPFMAELKPTAPKERIVVLSGTLQAECAFGRFTLERRDWLDIPQTGVTLTNIGTTQAEIGRIAGHWQDVIRTEICLFRDENPCDYHYHDGDEYWFVFRGHFTLDYAGRKYAVKPGMVMAAGMGYEHGALEPGEQFQAIVFATQLEGAKRNGHLNRETHGAPVPGREVPESVFDNEYLLEGASV